MVRERLSNLHNPLKLQCTVVECIALSSTTTAEMKTPRFCPTKMEVIRKKLCIWGHSITTWTRWGGRGSKNVFFVHAQDIKMSTQGVGEWVGQNMAKFCPRSCWMPSYGISYLLSWYAVYCDKLRSLAMRGSFF